ncbi:MAG: PilZ domain-containing protein [Alphaproteobacteria bacterium]
MAQKQQNIVIERRAHSRRCNLMTGHIKAEGQSANCAIYNLSVSGALIVSRLHFSLHQEVELEIPYNGTVAAKVVRVTPTTVAIAFLKEIEGLGHLADKI